MMKAAGRAWDAQDARQDRAQPAAESAELLRQELRRARIDLELFERNRSRSEAASPPPVSVTVRRRFPGAPGPTRGVGVGLWLITFYLLLVALAHGSPDAAPGPDSSRASTSLVRAWQLDG